MTEFDVQLKLFVESLSNEESFDKIYPETLKNDYQRSYLFKYFDRQVCINKNIVKRLL